MWPAYLISCQHVVKRNVDNLLKLCSCSSNIEGVLSSSMNMWVVFTQGIQRRLRAIRLSYTFIPVWWSCTIVKVFFHLCYCFCEIIHWTGSLCCFLSWKIERDAVCVFCLFQQSHFLTMWIWCMVLYPSTVPLNPALPWSALTMCKYRHSLVVVHFRLHLPPPCHQLTLNYDN